MVESGRKSRYDLDINAIRSIIGQGIYTLSEAARYARVPQATATSWFKPRGDRAGLGLLFDSDYAPIDGDYAISFLNLAEVYVARFFRNEGVKPSVLREARLKLQDELQTPYPFAHASLRTDGIRVIRDMGDSRLVDVLNNQHFIPQMKLGRFRFSSRTGLAEAWGIEPGITIDPTINFGKPVIENTGVSTLIVARQYVANGKNAPLVARLFKLTDAGVLNAYGFETSYGRIAA